MAIVKKRTRDRDCGRFSQTGEIKKDDATPCLACHQPYAQDSYVRTYKALVNKAAQ